MVFSSLFFLYLFLPLCVICYAATKKNRYRNAVLIIFSLIFYAWGEPLCVFILIISAALNYILAFAIDKYRGKLMGKLAVFFAVFFDLAVLGIFKYSGFIAENLNALLPLNLPVPEAEFINEVLKPSEEQQEMVSDFSERAESVRGGLVNPTEDNMLKITNDGRKCALDQRLLNELLPDAEKSKVNTCVENAFQVWDEGKTDRTTQLIFCDLSTPKGDGTFNVYDDVRNKLVARGIPKEEIAFIHEYNTEAKKAELFAKVRAGQVRILMGSTPKLGAGTNVQDRLIALHHLDCPWKPSDVGRILRTFKIKKNVEVTDNGKIII